MYLAGGTALRVRVGRALTPLSRAQGKRARNGWMPVIEVTAADGPVRYEIAYWATPLPDARDWQKAFNWPTEGENYLNWISIQPGLLQVFNHKSNRPATRGSIAVDPSARLLDPQPLATAESERSLVSKLPVTELPRETSLCSCINARREVHSMPFPLHLRS